MPDNRVLNFQRKSFLGGMNSDVSGSLIRPDQYVRGVNVSSRGGSPRTRPILSQIDVSLASGKFQGSSIFSLDSADRIVIAIEGHIYTYNLSTDTLTQVTDDSTRLSQTEDIFYFVQADQFFIIQDGVNIPIIMNFDGNNPDEARKAFRTSGGGPVNEVPTGTVMAYGHGRLAVALTEFPEGSTVEPTFFAVGDILLPNNRATVLQFDETIYLAGGGAFALPNELGLIEGMGYLKNAMSGSGLGSLIVYARNGAAAFKINAPRATWQDIDISDVLFTGKNMGTLSDKSLLNINNDLVYRSVDGLRSVGYTTAKGQGGVSSPANDTLSRPIDRELDRDALENLKYCYTAEVRNRWYVLTQDITASGEHAYDGIMTMDTAVLSIYGQNAQPEFDGFWTGLNFQAINAARYNGFYELFINSKSSEGENRLYYLNEGESEYVDGTASSPVSRIYLGGIDLSAEGDNRKPGKFEFASIWASDLIGEVSFTVYWRPYAHPLWQSTSVGTVNFSPTGLPGIVQDLRVTPGSDVCGTELQLNLNISKIYEFVIEWTGRARLDAAVFNFSPQDAGINAACDNTGENAITITVGTDGEQLNDFAYKID